jgi:transposase-like protein
MGYRPPYDDEFKRRAVKLVTDLGMSFKDVAADLGCSAEAIRGWVRQAEREIRKAAAAFFAQETGGTR